MNSYDPIGYIYEAAVHCEFCAVKRFPQLTGIDRNGNEVAVYSVNDAETADSDTCCDDCHDTLYTQD